MISGTDRVALLKTNPFFAEAPPNFINQVALVAREERFARGTFIYAKNDPAEDFYILVDGKIGHPEVQAAESQYSVAMETDRPGQLFGFAALVQGMPQRVISARCERDCLVLVINGRRVQELAGAQGRAGHELLQKWTRSFAAHERGIARRVTKPSCKPCS